MGIVFQFPFEIGKIDGCQAADFTLQYRRTANRMLETERLSMNASWKTHPDADALEGYAMGRLGEPESERVEEHLLVCAECRVVVEQIDGFVAMFQDAVQGSQDEGACGPESPGNDDAAGS